jgi:hypothetical protein
MLRAKTSEKAKAANKKTHLLDLVIDTPHDINELQ